MLFKFPDKALFGKTLPKSKIYKHGRTGTAAKNMFTEQVEKIVWQYKLAPSIINVKETSSVSEIQVLSITLRNKELAPEVLRCIDNAIPSPILFELHFDGKIKPIAAYKRPSKASIDKWVTSEYFDGGWAPASIGRKPLPMAINLGILYEHLLTPLMPFPARPDEDLQLQIERIRLIRNKQRELERCGVRLRREKQYNRKVEINNELRCLKQELEELTDPFPASHADATL